MEKKQETPRCGKCGGKAEHHLALSQPFGTRYLDEPSCAECVVGRVDEAVRQGEAFYAHVTPLEGD